MLSSNAKRTADRKAKPKPADAPDSSVGNALRSVYEQTVDESIPQEMLDLLGKLK
jgi:hypothetical protein